MLKTVQEPAVFVTQPDHGQLAGYLAAHWGNDDFSRPGHYYPVPHPERLRAETVGAIALHDNGWWEQDALLAPAADGLPAGLAEILKVPQEGMERWRLGLRRFPQAPYQNLLVSYHATWLYAAKTIESPDPAFLHPLFWKGSPGALMQGPHEEALGFIDELQAMQSAWRRSLEQDAERKVWLEPECLWPHVRLLQILDGLSLYLTSAVVPAREGPARGLGRDEISLVEVPRGSWQDRLALDLTPLGHGRIRVTPFPFDQDPLPVTVPARVIARPTLPTSEWQTWWNAQPLDLLRFELVSSSTVR
jgi:hypothetical protein